MDLLIANDLCPDIPAEDVSMVTRSQTAALRQQANQMAAQSTQMVPDDNTEADESSDMNLSLLFEESETSVPTTTHRY